jgi:predicted MarR family transcription regulator
VTVSEAEAKRDFEAKAFAVQVLHNLAFRGGSARVRDLVSDRHSRLRVQSALQRAAREGLVTSRNAGAAYSLTQKAWGAIHAAARADAVEGDA